MCIVDKVILILLGIGAISGLFRGLFKEVVGTIGLVVAAIAANQAAPYLQPYASSVITNENICNFFVWLLTFILVMLLLTWLAGLLEKLTDTIQLSWLNRLAGAAFGTIKCGLILSLLFSLLEALLAHLPLFDLSTYVGPSVIVPYLHQLFDVVAPWASQHILAPALELLK